MLRAAPRATLTFALTLCLVSPAAGAAAAPPLQDQGLAVITSPLEGATITGMVPITGSALHPQFQRYELAFAYDPNPTDTWFAIQDPATTQIVNDVIGRWDTTQISDGVYAVRLRVYFSDTGFLESIVRRVHVQNSTPTPPPTEATATASAAPSPAAATPSGVGTATSPVIELPSTATPRGTPATEEPLPTGRGASGLTASVIQRAFLNGAGLALGAFVLLGLYYSWRAYRRHRPK